jgi:Uma2 family endonuclease
MVEYRDCGVRLGWLIDPHEKRVDIYRLGRPTEYLNQPEQLSGEDVLPGFVLTLAEIWG